MVLRIVTDSTCDLPADVVQEYGIAVVPLSVLFGDEELLDGVDITSDEFFARLVRESAVPTTSQPPPQRFRDVYESLASEGAGEILSIHVSGSLSGTLEAARQGAAGLDKVRIRHVDSRFTSLALGLGVITAARAAQDGRPLDELIRRLAIAYYGEQKGREFADEGDYSDRERSVAIKLTPRRVLSWDYETEG